MNDETRLRYNQFLENLSDKLDIPPSKYQQAVDRYQAVGNWLNDGDYEGSNDFPAIYPQGSFRLGTVVRPLLDGKEADYDIDLVCRLAFAKETIIPDKIKRMVGRRLKENGRYEPMLGKEGKRCWTLNYAEADGVGFHMDILPAAYEDPAFIKALIRSGIPEHLATNAIAITHKDQGEYDWLSSNPVGYARWFDGVKQVAFERIAKREKQFILQSTDSIFASVDAVPDQLVRTPLQRSIQILKRHRDLRFAGHALEDSKPISMIITTLAARFYNSEADLYSTLENIVRQLSAHARLLNPGYILEAAESDFRYIQRHADGAWYISNPVNPKENFADRWQEDNNRRAKAFFQWVAWVSRDLVDVLKASNMTEIGESMQRIFGEKMTREASNGVFILGAPAVISAGRHQERHVEIRSPLKPYGHRFGY